VNEVLTSGSSYILLNGVPDKSFPCKRGVRQGDPCSLMLFVQGVDLLQPVNIAYLEVLQTAPIRVGDDYPIIDYADSTIIVLPADCVQLAKFKDILGQYASFTRLKVKYNKYSMIPINVPHEEVMSTHASIPVDSVGPPRANVCRTTTSFP
jgi:hypothetical protein